MPLLSIPSSIQSLTCWSLIQNCSQFWNNEHITYCHLEIGMYQIMCASFSETTFSESQSLDLVQLHMFILMGGGDTLQWLQYLSLWLDHAVEYTWWPRFCVLSNNTLWEAQSKIRSPWKQRRWTLTDCAVTFVHRQESFDRVMVIDHSPRLFWPSYSVFSTLVLCIKYFILFF